MRLPKSLEIKECLFILLPKAPEIKEKPKLKNGLFKTPSTLHFFSNLKSTLVKYHLPTMKCISWKCTIQQILTNTQTHVIIMHRFEWRHWNEDTTLPHPLKFHYAFLLSILDPETHWFVLCHYRCILSVQKFHLNWTTQYLSFHICLLSLSTTCWDSPMLFHV